MHIRHCARLREYRKGEKPLPDGKVEALKD
jgi:hypothetical protein